MTYRLPKMFRKVLERYVYPEEWITDLKIGEGLFGTLIGMSGDFVKLKINGCILFVFKNWVTN